MDVQVLGPLTTEGATLSPRERAILSVLIVASGAAVSADELADAYWGANPPVTWLQQVKTSVARIRRRLGPDAVRTIAGGYALGLDPDAIDAVRFERLVSAARAHRLHGDAERAVDAYQRALRLWHGVAYPDVGSWAPGIAESFRLDEIRQTAEEELLEARLALGEHHAVVADAERLVREQPLREARWAILALAAYRSDRQADALATIQTARSRLRDELGIEPGKRLAELEGAILRQDAALDPPASPPPAPLADCPYRGLDAFGTEDADTFFGRDADIERLLERVVPGAFVTLTGASGTGKSSILLAGLVPRLRQRGISVDLVSPLHFDDLPAAGERRVVVIDQFEELFTHTDVYVGARAAALRDLIAHGGTVVIAMRSDFLDRCLAQPDLAPLIGDGIQPVLPLGPAQLRDVVEQPARTHGLRLEPGLVELILRDTVDRPAALPMLSHALLETWRRREGSVLTVDGYEAAGGIAGAIANSAEELYRSLSDDEQRQLRAIMLRLMERLPDGATVRRRSPLAPLTETAARARLVNRLVAARLVSVETGTASVTHEALGIAWPRLDAWLREDALDAAMLASISAAASAWVAGGRTEDELLRGARLQAMLEWRTAAAPDLTADETALLTASEARADEELRAEQLRAATARRQNRRLRGALVGAAVLLVAAIVGGSLAAVRSQDAFAAAEDARIEAIVAKSLALRANDRDAAALLAAEAYRRWPDDARVRSALLGTITASEGLLDTHVASDAERTATAAITGTGTALRVRDDGAGSVLEVIDVATGEVSRALDVDLDSAFDETLGERAGSTKRRDLSVSANGHTAVVTSGVWRAADDPDCCSGQLSFVDLETGTLLPGSQIIRMPAGRVAISPDGGSVYIRNVVNGAFLAIDTRSGAVRTSDPAALDNQIPDLSQALSALSIIDSDTIATATVDRIDLFDHSSLELVRSIPLGMDAGGAALASDGSGGLISSSYGGRLARVDLATGTVTWSRSGTPAESCWSLLSLPAGVIVCGSIRSLTAFDSSSGNPIGSSLATQVDSFLAVSALDDRTVMAEIGTAATWMRWRVDGTGAAVELVAPGHRAEGPPSSDGRFVATSPLAGGPMQLWDLTLSAPSAVEADGIMLLSGDVIEYYVEGEGYGLQNIETARRYAYRIPGLPDDFQLFDGGPGPLSFVFFEGQVVAFDPETGEPVGAPLLLPKSAPAITSISESPDGTHVLVNWYDQLDDHTRPGVFNLDDGAMIVSGRPLRGGPTDYATSYDYAVFTPSGEIIGVSDTQMERVDPTSLDVLSALPSAEGGSVNLAASNDGRTILNVGWDNQARLFDLSGGIPLGDAIAIDSGSLVDLQKPPSAQLTTDGKTLLTNSPQGILAWDLRPRAQAQAACAIAGRELTAEEWTTYFPGEPRVATCAELAS